MMHPQTPASAALRKLPAVALAATLLFTVTYFYFAHDGFYFSDDYYYSKYAFELTQGIFQFEPWPFCHRFMVFAPVALIFLAFGINAYTITLWPLLCTLGTLALVYGLARRENPVAAAWAVVLLGINFHILNTSNFLYPDNIVMFFALAAAACLYVYRQQQRHSAGLALLFVLCNLAAFLSKETIVLYLPFYLFVFLLDVAQKRPLQFWWWALGFGLLLLGAYLLAYYLGTGDAFYRLHNIEETNRSSKGNYITNPGRVLWPRLTYAPLLFLIGSGFMVPVLLAFPAIFGKTLQKHFRLQSPESYWLLLSLFTLLLFWFSSTSLKAYNPIMLLPRMLTPLLPPLCLLAGYGMSRYQQGSHRYTGIFALCFWVCTAFFRDKMVVTYLLPALFFTLLWFLQRVRQVRPPLVISLAAMAVFLAVRPVYFMLKPTVSSFFDQEKILFGYLNEQQQRHVVYTDSRLAGGIDFYYRFRPNPHYVFRKFDEASAADAAQFDRRYLLINRGVLQHPELRLGINENEVLQKFPERKLVVRQGNVTLYELK